MRNYQYVDIIGLCFAKMSSTAERWNRVGDELEKIKRDIMVHPNQYPGKNIPSKMLRNEEVRQMLADIHQHRCWLLHQSQILHYENKRAMAIMGISEKQLKKFYEKMSNDPDINMEAPSLDYDITPLNSDSLTTLQYLDDRLEQINATRTR